jgi:hypothetical protein
MLYQANLRPKRIDTCLLRIVGRGVVLKFEETRVLPLCALALAIAC